MIDQHHIGFVPHQHRLHGDRVRGRTQHFYPRHFGKHRSQPDQSKLTTICKKGSYHLLFRIIPDKAQMYFPQLLHPNPYAPIGTYPPIG